MSKHNGKCALCGIEGELTFEHIPPRSAFNDTPSRPVSGHELFKAENLNDAERMPWDTTGMQYTHQQKGMGYYCLCQSCNNNTGTLYGDSYVVLARTVHNAMTKRTPDDPNGIGFREMYPLRFIKQVISMFCSINNPNDPKMEELRKFVLDKDAKGLDRTKYKLCMYFTETTLRKYNGVCAVLKKTSAGLESMILSEITAYPFGFILYFNPTETWDYKGTDITECADFGYDDKADILFPWKIEEMNDHFPEVFRSCDTIRKERRGS